MEEIEDADDELEVDAADADVDDSLTLVGTIDARLDEQSGSGVVQMDDGATSSRNWSFNSNEKFPSLPSPSSDSDPVP